MSKNMKDIKSQAMSIDFNALIAPYKRYWWLFVASLVVCIGLAVLYLQVKKPEYLIASSVLVAQDDNSSGAGQAILKSLSIGGGGSRVDDEVFVLSSHDLCFQMISQLKLNRSYVERKSFFDRPEYYGNSPISIDAPDELLDTLSLSMAFKVEIAPDGRANVNVKKGMFTTLASLSGVTLPVSVKTPYGIFVVRTTSNYVPRKEYTINATVTGNMLATEAMQKRLLVKVASKKSNVIYMDVTDTNKKRGCDILNTLVALYNERGQRSKDEQAINTGKFIEDRLGLIYKDLTGSEEEIEAYKRAHNMIDVGLQTKSLIGKQEIADRAIVNLESKYRIAAMIKEFINDPANRNAYIPFSNDSTAASGSIKAYNSLIMERMRLAASATDDNQAMHRIDDQIEIMKANVLRGVDNTMSALKIQINRAGVEKSASGGELSSYPTDEREMRALYRQQGIQNTLYTFLLQKREENALLLAATTPKGKIVDYAYAQNKPVKPRTGVVLFIAFLLGIIIPVAILVIKNLFYTKFTNEDELERIAQMPVIGHIHHNRHDESLVVQEGRNWIIVELFRYVRNNIQFMLTGENDKVVLVTSSMSSEGKSFVSLNIASAFALLGKRVALVGMDIRKPRIANMLPGIASVPGVTAYLSQSSVTLDEITQHVPEVPGLDVLVAGAIPPNPSELLLNKRVQTLFEELRAKYDLIIVDSAPVAMVSDTFSLAEWSDMTLCITRASVTKRSQVKYLNRLAEEARLKNVAILINDTKPNNDNGYGYGYGEDK